MITERFHGFELAVTGDCRSSICYLLMPAELPDAELQALDTVAHRFSVRIAVISGMDWNKDLTPWTAKCIRKKDSDFGGGARIFLDELKEEVFPYIESGMSANGLHRYLIGVSLSGLFAVWGLCSGLEMDGVCSISGSFWYDGFCEWLAQNSTCVSGKRVCLLLGDREKAARDARLASVESCTRAVCDTLASAGADCSFELVPGTHFSDIAPRLERAFELLFE